MGLAITPAGVITAFCLVEASAEERPIGEILIRRDGHGAYLAEKGFSSLAWERHWLESHGALVAATPKDNSKRAWPKADRRWASFAGQAPDHRGGHKPVGSCLKKVR